jgi:hypothetical protein
MVFCKSLEPDILISSLYAGRIHFIPQEDTDNSIHAALMELDERTQHLNK